MFTALHSGVYVRCMCGNNKTYTPTIVFVYNEIMCAFLLQCTHSFIMYKNNGNKHKMFLSKNQVSRVGEKSTQTRGLTSDASMYNIVHFYNLTLLGSLNATVMHLV